jgi:hypothetical protein
MDRDMIARASRWLDKNGKVINNFVDVIEELPLKNEEKNTVMLAIKSFTKVIENLPLTMAECEVDADIIKHCARSITQVCENVEKGHGNG